MKSSTVGLVFKTLLVVALIAVAVDIFLIYYNGYRHVNALYGAPAFFFWHAKLIDKKLAKLAYKPIKPNEHYSSDALNEYLDAVQKKPDTAKRVYPYYAFDGLPDTFVLGVKHTWTLFKDKAVRAVELQFLALRAQFIQKMLNIELKDGKYEDNPAFQDKSRKKTQFVPMEKKDVRDFFAKEQHNTLISSRAFNTIVGKVLAGTPDYSVRMEENSAKMSAELEKDVMALVKPAFEMLGWPVGPKAVEMVNAWFLRLATVKVSVEDAHVLNRLYWYFFYNHNYLRVTDADSSSHRKLSKELEALPKDNMPDEKKRKKNSLEKKMGLLRTEMVLTKFSQLMARLLGGGPDGVLLKSGQDKRPFWRTLHAPRLATADDFKNDGDYKGESGLFEKDMKEYMRDFLQMGGN